MSRHHKIEFEPGEVVRPEYDPENNLVGLIVTNEGLSSLRNAVSEAKNPDERRQDAPPGASNEGDPVTRPPREEIERVVRDHFSHLESEEQIDRAVERLRDQLGFNWMERVGNELSRLDRRVTAIEEELFSPSNGGGASRERSSERD